MTPTDDWRSLYPFESRWLSLDGRRCHYVDEGRGEPLLLVHGNPTWSFYWRELIKGLRDKYRLVAPDHLGCGLSDKPADFSYRLADHISVLRRLIEELDLRDITLVAHDWGGAIGMGAAVEMPDRFARFVLLNTAAFRSHRLPRRIRLCRTPVLGKLLVQGLNAFARGAARMAVERPEGLTPQAAAGLLAPYDSWRNRIAIHRFIQDIPLEPSHASYAALAKIEARLPDLADRPTALMWGMRDWCFTPEFLNRFLDFFPQAEVQRLDDAGHYVVEDAWERIVPALHGFLERHPLDLQSRPASIEQQGIEQEGDA